MNEDYFYKISQLELAKEEIIDAILMADDPKEESKESDYSTLNTTHTGFIGVLNTDED